MLTRLRRVLAAAPVLAMLVMVSPILLAPIAAAQPGRSTPAGQPLAFRAAAFNIEDIQTLEILSGSDRLRRAAEVIQRLRPHVLLINEIAYDMPGAMGYDESGPPGQNARRFAEDFLARSQAPGLKPLRYDVFMPKSNTGLASGFDLDRSGEIVTVVPPQPIPVDGEWPPKQTAAGRAYGGDAWGFGTFPGQYAMAVFVDERFEILRGRIRTFRLFPWRAMPNGLAPMLPSEPGDDDAEPEPWYAPEAWELFRLSSKTHADVPVRLPNGAVVHLLISHPTPPAFDGPEARNKKRNRDEIRFWADYVEDATYIVDDEGVPGGLEQGAHFLIMGDLNADPAGGSTIGDPISEYLFASRFVDGSFTPKANPPSDRPSPRLDPADTARWGKRVDYVLPSRTLRVLDGGVWRRSPPGARDFPSDHFPVWLDIAATPPDEAPQSRPIGP